MIRLNLFFMLFLFLITASTAQTSAYESTIDHEGIIRNLNDKTLLKGKIFYDQVCAACHGEDGTSFLAAARSFNKDNFKYGRDPYSMWKSITNGAGQMGAQRWLSPDEAYAVVHYIREEIVKDNNPQSYFEVTNEYLENLPKSLMTPEQMDNMIRNKALSGSQEFGQKYFGVHPGNYGLAMYSQLKDHASSALTINLGEEVYISYNVQRMSPSTAWKGALDLSKTKYELYRRDWEPKIVGDEIAGFNGMHWSFKDRYQQLENLVSDRSPYPSKWLNYNGHYQHDGKTILSYSVVGREILEMPSAKLLNNQPVIQHTFNIAPGDSWRKVIIGRLKDPKNKPIKEGVFALNDIMALEGLPEEEWINPENSLIITGIESQDKLQFLAAGIQGDTEGMHWVVEKNHQLALFIPPSNTNQVIRLHRFSGQGIRELDDFAKFINNSKKGTIPNPEDYTKGGNRLWDKTISLQGALNVGVPHYNPIHYEKENRTAPNNLVKIPENYPYVVDKIPLPFDNPWNSWIRPSGFDFFPDGRLAMCTYAGDVWIANGIDNDLKAVKWQRIATGLYDPFGLKVVDDDIYITCRDRIVRLNDLNGDGETDFYECFFADTDVSHTPVQAFNYSLQTDSKGNFYYAKGGQYTRDDEAGHVIRVSHDGQIQESVAIGFRAPNGVTIGPKDDIYVSDNQGTWMPANKINLIKKGGFYGYIPSIGPPTVNEYRMRAPLAAPNYPDEILPDTFDKPIIWLPQEFDSSPGGGAWSSKDWGPLGNRLIYTSYGKGWVYQVMMQEIRGITQAAVSALPFQFSAGTQRARINPVDGQYYIAGITGWDDSFASQYGSLDRIRYYGGDGFFIDAVNVRQDGIEFSFNQKLNTVNAKNIDHYDIEQWNYRWTQNYGSAHWSVKDPEKQGHDTVGVKEVGISNGGKNLHLKISNTDLVPVDQMRVQLSVDGEDGQSYQDVIYLTIHNVPTDETAINRYVKWILGLLFALIFIYVIWNILLKESFLKRG